MNPDRKDAAGQGLTQAGNSLTGYSTLDGSLSTGLANIAATHGSPSVNPIMVNKALIDPNWSGSERSRLHEQPLYENDLQLQIGAGFESTVRRWTDR